jgi:ABC-type sugar transport system ATPase subunit
MERGDSVSAVLLELKGVTKQYPGVKALDDVSLKIRAGEVHALVGENGAGKSTLIKILAGIVQPDAGVIIFDGKQYGSLNPALAKKLGISVIYQDLSLFPNLSVAENIAMGEDESRAFRLAGRKRMREKAEQALAMLGIELDLGALVGELSVGKQQLVAIARALVGDCKLLIMDEPTSSLSRKEVDSLYNIVMKLKQSGITVLFIGHKFDEIYRFCDTATVLRDGQYIGTLPLADLPQERLIEMMVGRKLANLYPKAETAKGDVLLEAVGLTKRGQFYDIHLTVRAGEVVGITGLVGAGRSEVAMSLFGLNRPDEGKVFMRGREVDLRSPKHCIRAGIAFVPESRQTQGLAMLLSMRHNVTLSIMDRIARRRWWLPARKELEITASFIERLSIRPPYPAIQVGKLSGGNQQKVVLAKWLATNPSVLILDEPTNGIDIGAKAEIYRLIQEMAQSGIGIILISSELPEVLAMSDRILVMREGRISGELRREQATQQAIMRLAVPGMDPAAEAEVTA